MLFVPRLVLICAPLKGKKTDIGARPAMKRFE